MKKKGRKIKMKKKILLSLLGVGAVITVAGVALKRYLDSDCNFDDDFDDDFECGCCPNKKTTTE